MQASHCGDFSGCGACALEHGFSSYGTQALLFHGTWTLPRPRIEPVSPTLAGRFLSATRKVQQESLCLSFCCWSVIFWIFIRFMICKYFPLFYRLSFHFPFFPPFLFTYYFWLWWVFIATCKLSLVAVSRGYTLVAVHGLPIAVAFLVAEHGLWSVRAQ